MQDNILMLFAKYPEPGKVKTRLAKSIGIEKSAKIYQAFLSDEMAKFHGQSFDLSICINPSSLDDFRGLFGEKYRYLPHKMMNSDLGVLMSNTFRWAFQEGYKKAIIIGSDVPHLEVSDIHKSFAALDHHDVTLGPDGSGGMYLIAMNKPFEVLNNIEWSRGQDFEEVKKRVEAKALRLNLLDEIYDIDHIEDLKKLYCDQRLANLKNTRVLLDQNMSEISLPDQIL